MPGCKIPPISGRSSRASELWKEDRTAAKEIPKAWMSSSLLGSQQISADLSRPLPSGPAVTPGPLSGCSVGGWPGPHLPPRLTSAHPQVHQYQTLSYTPKTQASPSSAPLLELLLLRLFHPLYLLGDSSHLSKLRSVSLKPPNPHFTCQGHRTSLTASQISPPSSPHSPHSVTLGSFPSLKQ